VERVGEPNTFAYCFEILVYISRIASYGPHLRPRIFWMYWSESGVHPTVSESEAEHRPLRARWWRPAGSFWTAA
jgi:hypothetical protein